MATNEVAAEEARLTGVSMHAPQLFASANEIDALDMWSDAGEYVATTWDVMPSDAVSHDLYNNLEQGDQLFGECSGDDFLFYQTPLEDVPQDTDCAICFEVIVGDDKDNLRRLHCDHWFHARCIMPWLFKKQSCPTCRTAVTSWEW